MCWKTNTNALQKFHHRVLPPTSNSESTSRLHLSQQTLGRINEPAADNKVQRLPITDDDMPKSTLHGNTSVLKRWNLSRYLSELVYSRRLCVGWFGHLPSTFVISNQCWEFGIWKGSCYLVDVGVRFMPCGDGCELGGVHCFLDDRRINQHRNYRF